MIGGNSVTIDGKPDSSGTYVQQNSGISQVHPTSLLLLVSLMGGNAMMAAQCGHGDSLSRPANPATGEMTITVKNVSNEVIGANARQDPNGFYRLTRGLRAALTTTSARQAQLRMSTASPVQGESKLAG